jgi:hypothetical protein
MNLVTTAITTMVISAICVIWGSWYRSNHVMEGAMGMFFGGASSTYTTAGWAMGLGGLAFLVGIGVLIAGLVQRGGSKATD